MTLCANEPISLAHHWRTLSATTTNAPKESIGANALRQHFLSRRIIGAWSEVPLKKEMLALSKYDAKMELFLVKPPQGPIQRRIWRMFLVRPNAAITTTELCRGAYPRAGGVITHNHRRSVRGAALAVAKPVGRSISGKGRLLKWVGLCSDVASVLPNAKNEPDTSNETPKKTKS